MMIRLYQATLANSAGRSALVFELRRSGHQPVVVTLRHSITRSPPGGEIVTEAVGAPSLRPPPPLRKRPEPQALVSPAPRSQVRMTM